MSTVQSPYPWFGGKARVSSIIWERLGDVKHYVEPFFGGGAILLNRPATQHDLIYETVNDINGWLANFWRAVSRDPDGVAAHASDPVNELDLHARGDWLFYRPDAIDFVERVRSDPDYYCIKSAGWWVWGQSAWIAGGWARTESRDMVARQRPHLTHGGKGINKKRPHLSFNKGINRKIPAATEDRRSGITDTTRKATIAQYMRGLCERTAYVRVCCGDWLRVTGPSVTQSSPPTGMVLDPPYIDPEVDKCYGEDHNDVSSAVREYCLKHGHNIRIALCGYDTEHNMPPDWDVVKWTTNGGYAGQGSKENINRHRERIWFSPSCLKPSQITLFK